MKEFCGCGHLRKSDDPHKGHVESEGCEFCQECDCTDFHTIVETADRISTCGYKLGIVSVYENLPKELREKAGKQFAAGQDMKAKLYRDLAEEIEKEAKVRRKEFDQIYRTSHDECLLELRNFNSISLK